MFVQFYKDNKSNGSVADAAKQKLVTDLLSDKKYGTAKLTDIDDLDMESHMTNIFIPGLFCTFIYKADNDSVSGVQFGDYMPIVLCCKKFGKFVEGINFNMIPAEHRAVILEVLDKGFSNFLTKTGPENAASGKVSVPEQMGAMLLDEKRRVEFLKLLESRLGCSVAKAYRKYNISHIDTPRLIEYSSLKYIPLLSFEGSVRDANILKVQEATVSGNDK